MKASKQPEPNPPWITFVAETMIGRYIEDVAAGSWPVGEYRGSFQRDIREMIEVDDDPSPASRVIDEACRLMEARILNPEEGQVLVIGHHLVSRKTWLDYLQRLKDAKGL